MYSPIHPQIYAAAFAAALAGIETVNRNPTITNPLSYESACAIADAFAQEYDTQYSGTSGFQDVLLTNQLSLGFFIERYPRYVNPSDYTSRVATLLAILTQANTHVPNIPGGAQGSQGNQGFQGAFGGPQGTQGNQGNQGGIDNITPRYNAEWVSLTDNPDLSAFDVTNVDSSGPASENDIVLLSNQSDENERGPYVVGPVNLGFAKLTRPSWWSAGSSIKSGTEIFIVNGEKYIESVWRSFSLTDVFVVGAADPLLYPVVWVGNNPYTMSNGVVTITGAMIDIGIGTILLFNRTQGINCALTAYYDCVVNTSGQDSDGLAHIYAKKADGTNNTADTSSFKVAITNNRFGV
jgi:hypothetical protein